MPPLVTHLRRELRAADCREYEQQTPTAAAMPALPPAKRRFGPVALAVCVATVLACFAAGAVMDIAATPAGTRATATVPAAPAGGAETPAIQPATTVVPAASVAASAAGVPHPVAVKARPAAGRKVAARRQSAAAHPSKASRIGAALRFEWLRHRFAIDDDL